MIRKRFVWIIIGMLVISVSCQRAAEVKYLDTVRLVENYEMNKVLLHSLEKGLLDRKAIVDSQLAGLKANNPSKYESERMLQYQELERSQGKGLADIQEAVWNRLNPVLRDFGQEKEYSILFGANGLGSIIYADDAYDVTDEAINYINKNYRNE